MRTPTIAFLFTALAACGGKTTAEPKSCPQQAAAIATHLRTMNHEPSTFFVPGAKLVTRAELPRDQAASGPVVQVTAADTTFQGMAVGSDDELRERLDASRQKMVEWAERQRKPDPIALFIAVDEDVPWARVAGVTEAAARAGFTDVRFGFALPKDATKPPPRSKLDPELDALMNDTDGSNKATRFAELTRKAIAGCPAMEQAFAAAVEEDGDRSRADAIIDAIEPALVKCGCNFDVASFHSVMLRLLHVADVTTSLAVTLDEGGKRLELPAATPWREAGLELTAGARVWLAVR